MRYYNIQISGGINRTYTSFQNGKTLPGALNVELDIPVIPGATPMGNALVRVWGITLQEIAQASQLNNKLISVSGGMQKGLPLAKPGQAGLLISGFILQAFGNWIGTDMTLDMIVAPGPPPTIASNGLAQSRNLSFTWMAGQTLETALKQTLAKGYPRLTPNISISSNLVRADTQTAVYPNFASLAKYVKIVSQDTIKTNGYAGVDLTIQGGQLFAYDGSVTPTKTTNIAFEDMIGQPTWIDSPLIQIKTVMRYDLQLNSLIKLPPAVVTNTAQANSFQINQKSAFQGTFQVVQVRHLGNFRQPDAASWVTVIDAAPLNVASEGAQNMGAFIGV